MHELFLVKLYHWMRLLNSSISVKELPAINNNHCHSDCHSYTSTINLCKMVDSDLNSVIIIRDRVEMMMNITTIGVYTTMPNPRQMQY